MPRYYLHYHDGVDLTLDPDGAELPDLDAARAEAVKAARDFIAQGAQAGRIDLTMTIDVEDDRRQVLLSLRFSEAIELLT